MAPGLVAAAAIVVVAGLVVPGLLHKSPASTGVNNVALPAKHGPAPLSGQSAAAAPSFAGAGGTVAKTKQHAASRPSGLEGLRATGQRATLPLFVTVPPAVNGVNPRAALQQGPPGRGHRPRLGGVTEWISGAWQRNGLTWCPPTRSGLSPVHAPGTVDIVVSGQMRKSPVSPADRYTFTQ